MATGSFSETERRVSRKSHDFIGSRVHPTSSAGKGSLDGRVDKELFWSCRNCGMWCIGSRVRSPGGTSDGNGSITNSVSGGVGDPINNGGFCPDCGSANSRK